MIKSKMSHLGKETINLLPARGEIAAQEQTKVFGQAFASNREPRASLNRGEIAAQEQMRIIEQATENFTHQETVEGK
jgi:hypothetical protein